ncbi:MAG: PAS domain-containing sensor histidine kinase, partial [Spirochaetota bacterium]|nr:PAS domain-containing sensor histidine kinase [Spirochaetota bacterium]
FSQKELVCRIKSHLTIAKYSNELRKIQQNLEKLILERTTELKDSEERYRSLVEFSPEGIIVHNLNKIDFVNLSCSEVLAYSQPSLLVGKPLKDIIHPDYREVITKEFSVKGKSQLQAKAFEIKLLSEDQQEIEVEMITNIVIYNEEIRYLSIFRNVSEKRLLEKLRNEMNLILHHDLKSPLVAILGFSEMIMKKYSKNDNLMGMVQAINSGANDLVKIINKTIDTVKIENNLYKIEPKDIDFINVFRKIEKNLRPLCVYKSVDLMFLINEEPVEKSDSLTIMGEDILLENLFSNLIKNAIEASPNNEKVIVSIVDLVDKYEIQIKNIGVIPEELRDNFYKKFGTSGKSQGSGIGTYSAMLYTKAHHGQISYKSDEIQGTQVKVVLPKKQELS